MTEEKEQLAAIHEMRDLMNRSSRFLSLSGLSGICAGIFALLGAGAAWSVFHMDFFSVPFSISEVIPTEGTNVERVLYGFSSAILFRFLFIIASTVLFLSLVSAWYFARRKAKKAGILLWDQTAKRMLINLFIPLVAGGLFSLAMMWHGIIGLVAPATLIFYGLALLNASKYTINDIRYLGIMEICLGLIGTVFIGYGLLFWTIGFGLLHIVYGAYMYFKYERK